MIEYICICGHDVRLHCLEDRTDFSRKSISSCKDCHNTLFACTMCNDVKAFIRCSRYVRKDPFEDMIVGLNGL